MVTNAVGRMDRMDSSNMSVKSKPPRHDGPAQGPQVLSAATQSMVYAPWC